MSALSFSHVSIRLGSSLVVRDVSFDVPRGAWYSLIGPNGAGKTSLLRATIGLAAHSGAISIIPPNEAPVAIQSLSVRERARFIAYVPQQPVMPEGMTVFQYVLLGRTAHISRFGVESRGDVDVAKGSLHRLELDHHAGKRLTELSGGERQRAVIARALTQEAQILLLDEPTTALDIGHQQEVMELVDILRKERDLTVLSSMHDLTLAGQYSDTHVMLSEGEIVAMGSAREVLTSELIAKHYGAQVVVDTEGDRIRVMPIRPHSS